MKRLVVIAIAGLLALFAAGAQAQTNWEIEQYDSDITIETDGSVAVRETISVDFASLAKHGIYRDLPIVYRSGGEEIYTRIFDIAVLQDEQPAEVQITRNAANMRIRIGDPDITISERHVYEISYRVVGVLQSFDSFDELYWNVTGNDWEAPITNATATVHVPAAITQIECYEGALGVTAGCQEKNQEDTSAQFAASLLSPGEGLTIAVGFESGVVPIQVVIPPPSFADVIGSPLTLGLSALGLIVGIGWVIRRWWMYGRDRYWQRAHLPGVRSDREGKELKERIVPLFFKRVVSAEYDPPDGLRPAEIGVLVDEQANTLDISATIIDLAARGYLTIREVPKKWVLGKSDYEFTRTKKSEEGLLEYEHELLLRLFDERLITKLSDLRNTFYKHLSGIKDLLYKEVTKKGLFTDNPTSVRQKSVVLAIVVCILGGVLIGATGAWVSQSSALITAHYIATAVGISILGAGIVALGFSNFMPRKTGYGRELYDRVKGYELFVSGTEKYRAKFNEKEGLFGEVLPYAIMFGVTDKLARAFKEMGVEPPQPTWFHGATAFNAAQFAGTMDTFSSALSSTMTSRPSSSGSSGGGFSGGGFGGGGGGSW